MPIFAISTLSIVILSIAGVIVRPFRIKEAWWAVSGALLLVVSGLLPWQLALNAIGKGMDVYLFLTGMMLLSELARREGLFDTLAAVAVRGAKGSALRLFVMIYGIGVVITTFLSNDATAVVMTPAVFAAVKAAGAREAKPYLFICAFIANAASFVLPISNPANLVLYQSHTPPLLEWMRDFVMPSAASIIATYLVLWLTQRAHLKEPIGKDTDIPPLSRTGIIAACGLVLTAVCLMTASCLSLQLGLPTVLAGLGTTAAVLLVKKEMPFAAVRGMSWSVLPLVAGLFILVEGLNHIGAVGVASGILKSSAAASPSWTAVDAGAGLAIVCNLMNNLPAGLIAGMAVATAQAPDLVRRALLIGVDLGPNLSITGSLATILWLTALRREGEAVSGWDFLKLGLLVMPAALIPALIVNFLRG